MRKIVSYIQNKLLASGVKSAIENGEHKASVDVVIDADSCVSYCRSVAPDVFIAEVRDYPPITLDDWLGRSAQIKEVAPKCRVALIVDEESYPGSAQEIRQAFKNKEIDLFFYSSSGLNYLADTINGL